MNQSRHTPTGTVRRVGWIRNAVVALSVGSALAVAAGLGLTSLGTAATVTSTTGSSGTASGTTSSQVSVGAGSSTTTHATSSGS
ncbi:hypothetical protein [Nocardioides sp.]|uniref:hypothetical protein n=1 Tax=Nocardioides sp. TaxID=35761 RepID=UPI003D1454A5